LTSERNEDIIKEERLFNFLKGDTKMSNKEEVHELKRRVGDLVDEIELLKRDLLKLREDIGADIKDLYDTMRPQR